MASVAIAGAVSSSMPPGAPTRTAQPSAHRCRARGGAKEPRVLLEQCIKDCCAPQSLRGERAGATSPGAHLAGCSGRSVRRRGRAASAAARSPCRTHSYPRPQPDHVSALSSGAVGGHKPDNQGRRVSLAGEPRDHHGRRFRALAGHFAGRPWADQARRLGCFLGRGRKLASVLAVATLLSCCDWRRVL